MPPSAARADVPSTFDLDLARQSFDHIRQLQEHQEWLLGLSNVIFDRLQKEIQEFEKHLSADEELGGLLASFGRQVLIHIDAIDYSRPYLITFAGKTIPGGDRVRLVQHVTQLNVLLQAVPKSPDHAEPRRIGFQARNSEKP